MNAAEARKLAVENASKLANQYCKEPLVKIDRKINYAVKFGRFSVSVKFCPDDILEGSNFLTSRNIGVEARRF